jgi:hypothetical protein
VEKAGLPSALLAELKRLAAFQNPEALLADLGSRLVVEEQRNPGTPVEWTFQGRLTAMQHVERHLLSPLDEHHDLRWDRVHFR